MGGTSVGVDPIGVFRGAPDPALASEFIEFMVSEKGQKLWNWKPGTPGGPQRYALRRLPRLPSLDDPDWRNSRSDPDHPLGDGARIELLGGLDGRAFPRDCVHLSGDVHRQP